LGNIFAGCGLGLLVGLIAGLSVSPVVSVILGSLAAVLAAFLGLKDGDKATVDSNPEQLLIQGARRRLSGIRAGSFGCACVVGILLGMSIRATDFFLPQIDDQVGLWEQAGYSPDEARQFVVFERLGISPGWSSIEFGEVQKKKSSALFSGNSEDAICEEIKLDRYSGDASEVLYAYTQQDNEKLSALAGEITKLKLSTSQTHALIDAISETICEIESSNG
jgi:hypothetical protein